MIKILWNRLKNVMRIFTVLYTITICTHMLIDYFIFNQLNVSFYHLFLAVVFVFLLSLGLGIIYQIRVLSLIVQVFCTYILILASIYTMGIFNGWFNTNNKEFIRISFGINVLVVTTLIIIFIIRHHFQVRSLNQNLKLFKDRDHYDK